MASVEEGHEKAALEAEKARAAERARVDEAAAIQAAQAQQAAVAAEQIQAVLAAMRTDAQDRATLNVEDRQIAASDWDDAQVSDAEQDELRDAFTALLDEAEAAQQRLSAYAVATTELDLEAMRDAQRSIDETLDTARNAVLDVAGGGSADAAEASAIMERANEEIRSIASDELMTQAQNLYQDLAGTILPYDELRHDTGEFNRLVRDACELSTRDAEYIGLRLDADHIVEARVYEAFREEFAQLGIHSSGDMPAMALHTELHIRSGAGLNNRFDMDDSTLDGTLSWTAVKLEEIGRKELREKYETLSELVSAYKELYAEKAPRLAGPEIGALFDDWLSRLAGR